MRKIVSVLAVCLALILGGCSGNGLDNMTSLDTTNDDYKFDGIQQQLAVVDNTLNGLQTQINEINVLIAGQQEQLDKLAVDVAANAAAITTINSRIAELEAEAKECKEQYDALKAELDALKTQVATDNTAIDLRLTTLEGNVDCLKTRLCNLYGWVRDLCGRVSVLEEAMAKVPKANSPLFASVVLTDSDVWHQVSKWYGYWERNVQDPGVTIVWTASAGGVTATSYNVWAVVVNEDGSLGLPFKLANGTGTSYFWNGHTEGLSATFDSGSNPSPLSPVVRCVDTENPKVYRFAVTAVDANGNESAPSVTEPGKEIKVVPIPEDQLLS